MIGLIVARSKNNVIGKNGNIPWKIKGEQKQFRELTTGNVVIMGRKSYEEIGHPLPNRMNIVVSTTTEYQGDNLVMFKFGIGGANMPTRTPIPVSRAMRQISANLDLARRQQRIPVALLAERAGLSMPTVTKMLRTGNGSFENFLRIARLLGLLDGVQQATDPLNTDIGKLRADEDTPKRIR